MSNDNGKDNGQQLSETVLQNAEILAEMLSAYEPYVPGRHSPLEFELLTTEELVRRIRPTLPCVTVGDVARLLHKMGCRLTYIGEEWQWQLVRRT